MSGQREPSYTDLVHEVLRLAGEPLTIREIVERVSERRAIANPKPETTIRNVLSLATLLVCTGAGRYGYLPHLMAGSLLRLTLAEKKPANHPLVYTSEVVRALWPTYQEIRKRKDARPARLQFRDLGEISLSLESARIGTWGSPLATS